MAWPARFDPSGQYIYTPAFTHGGTDQPSHTTVADADSGAVVLELDGVPKAATATRRSDVVVSSAVGLVSVLDDVDGCSGVAVHVDERQLVCVSDAEGVSISPDGSKVAVAQLSGKAGKVEFLGGTNASFNKYDVFLLDVTSGAGTVVARDAYSGTPPSFTWNALSTHLLIAWPVPPGL